MTVGLSTPQSLRKPDPRLWNRQQQDQELYDDLANAVFSTATSTLSVPMPISGVLEILASAVLTNAGTLTLNVDSVAGNTAITGTNGVTAVIVSAVGVAGGVHTVTITSAGHSSPRIICRRGRTPSS